MSPNPLTGVLPLQMGVPGGIEVLVILFIMLFTMIVPLVVAVLIYQDADTRNSGHALAWAVGSFFGGLVVWLLYYVVRDEVGA